MFVHNSTTKSRRNVKMGRRFTVPRVTFCISSTVKRSKVKVA